MKKNLRVACIQNNAGSDWEENLKRLERLVSRAVKRKAKLIALPETFCSRGRPNQFDFLARELTPRILQGFQEIARKTKTAFLLGSLLESTKRKKRYYNTSYLISESGKIAAKYRKIHLFDANMKKKKLVVQESKHIESGSAAVTGTVCGVKAGLSVCYDLRFPELYRRLAARGSRIIFVPANFTHKTGEAHWEALLRARAIENQAFVIAPGQTGNHPYWKIKSHGNSMIVDPWGRILGRAGRDREEVLVCDLDLSYQAHLRREFPVLTHRRLHL